MSPTVASRFPALLLAAALALTALASSGCPRPATSGASCSTRVERLALAVDPATGLVLASSRERTSCSDEKHSDRFNVWRLDAEGRVLTSARPHEEGPWTSAGVFFAGGVLAGSRVLDAVSLSPLTKRLASSSGVWDAQYRSPSGRYVAWQLSVESLRVLDGEHANEAWTLHEGTMYRPPAAWTWAPGDHLVVASPTPSGVRVMAWNLGALGRPPVPRTPDGWLGGAYFDQTLAGKELLADATYGMGGLVLGPNGSIAVPMRGGLAIVEPSGEPWTVPGAGIPLGVDAEGARLLAAKTHEGANGYDGFFDVSLSTREVTTVSPGYDLYPAPSAAGLGPIWVPDARALVFTNLAGSVARYDVVSRSVKPVTWANALDERVQLHGALVSGTSLFVASRGGLAWIDVAAATAETITMSPRGSVLAAPGGGLVLGPEVRRLSSGERPDIVFFDPATRATVAVPLPAPPDP